METKTFAELGLSDKVMEAVTTAGYTTPTPIQAGAIPMAVTGKDVLGIAQTGTGKTAAFVLPLLCRLERGRARARMPRSLILAPTRELAAQVSEAFETYGTNQKITMALLIGGVSFAEQLKKLDRGVDVLIATPGRLMDHHARGKLLLTGVEFLVIDEADRMLDMGFIPDIEKICKLLPPRRQTLFFSATMPSEITRLAGQFLKDPARVEVAPPATTAKTITQRFKFLPDGTDWVKREVLREMIHSVDDLQNAIIFCNRKRDVAILLKSLQKHGFNAGALHGDMDQSSRMATLASFRSGETTILAASDVAARGLDIPEVSHVFNYDMPWQSDDYVHRIGRTGRAGRQGFAAALVTADDLKVVRELEKAAGEPVEWIGDPPGEGAEEEGRRPRGRGGRGGRSSGRNTSRGGKAVQRARQSRQGESSENDGGSDGEQKIAADGTGKAARSRSSRGGRGRGRKTSSGSGREALPSKDIAAAQPQQASSTGDDHTMAPAKQQHSESAANSRGRRSRRRPESIRDGARSEQPAEKQVAPKEPVAESQPKAPRNNRNKSKQGADKAPARGKVEGAPRGLGDNVPAFLKRTVRASSS